MIPTDKLIQKHAQHPQLLVSTEGTESLCKTGVSCMCKTTFCKVASFPHIQKVHECVTSTLTCTYVHVVKLVSSGMILRKKVSAALFLASENWDTDTHAN